MTAQKTKQAAKNVEQEARGRKSAATPAPNPAKVETRKTKNHGSY